MNVIEISEKAIYGLSTRTTNANEINPETATIGKMWKRFDNVVSVDYKRGERVYGVYYNYESGVNGEFDVLAGCEKENDALDKAIIQKGKYVVFEGKATAADDIARIQAVVDTWGRVWEYFSNRSAQYKRAYTTDFEYYKNQSEIDIYISVI